MNSVAKSLVLHGLRDLKADGIPEPGNLNATLNLTFIKLKLKFASTGAFIPRSPQKICSGVATENGPSGPFFLIWGKALISDLCDSDLFHGIIAAHSGRRSAQSDAVHRASAATHLMGRYDPPERPGAFAASRVARRLWYTYHGATRALLAEKIAPVKWVAVTEIWYNSLRSLGGELCPVKVMRSPTFASPAKSE